jgi:hypothetical protein
MAEESSTRIKEGLTSLNPDNQEIARHLEETARGLQEFGHGKEAAYFTKWARELREKN